MTDSPDRLEEIKVIASTIAVISSKDAFWLISEVERLRKDLELATHAHKKDVERLYKAQAERDKLRTDVQKVVDNFYHTWTEEMVRQLKQALLTGEETKDG